MFNVEKITLIIVALFILNTSALAQLGLRLYTEIGKNNVSHGLYMKSSVMGGYRFKKYIVETSIQLDLKNGNKNVFSGYRINATRDFMIESVPLGLQAFFLYTTSFDILYETNWGASLNIRHNRFDMAIGTNFRTYAFTKKAIEQYGILKNATKIHEIFNIMYSFNYYLNPTDDNWNAGLSITNIDYFMINQETNPIFILRGLYKLSEPICLFAQTSYRIAGLTNLQTNFFGLYFRTGLIWLIN